MKKLNRYTPPFYSFPMKAFMTGRNLIIERYHLERTSSRCTDSGPVLQTLRR